MPALFPVPLACSGRRSRQDEPERFVTELVWPALNGKEGYESATVTMKDGTVVTGFKQTDGSFLPAERQKKRGDTGKEKWSEPAPFG